MACRYRLLALDLDGTLLNARGEVSPANARAVLAAREAGLRVVVCTGRGLVESKPHLDAIGQTDPVVVAGGAVIADPVSGLTLHRHAMDPGLVAEVTAAVMREGQAALVLKDRASAGYDYLVVTGESRPDPVSVWWFEKMRVVVRFVRTLAEDEHPEHTVRVGVVGGVAEAARAGEVLRGRFGGRAVFQSFASLVGSEATGEGEREIRIVEAFDPGSGKWPALRRLAAGLEVGDAEIAAIGDERNDLEMIRGAGLGVAMGNAVPEVLGVADRVTARHDEDGVAEAIGRILDGSW